MNALVKWMLLLGVMFSCFSCADSESPASSGQRQEEWDAETIDLFATLPVLSGGRVKPMNKFTGLRLLMLNGKRKLELDSGEELRPSSWGLEAIFFPDDARAQRVIRIENDAVLIEVGIPPRKKRDWYSFNELAPAREAILARARLAFDKEKGQRSVIERQMLKLEMDLGNFDALLGMLDPLRLSYDISESPLLVEIFGSQSVEGSLSMINHAGAISKLQMSVDPESAGDRQVLSDLMAEFDRVRQTGGGGPTLVPSIVSLQADEAWWGVSDLLSLGVLDLSGGQVDAERQMKLLHLLGELESVKLDRDAFRSTLKQFHTTVVAMATASGDYDHVVQEVKFYRSDPFTNALALFILAFLLFAIGLLFGNPKQLSIVIWVIASAGLSLVIYGIVMRSLIRERPPIVTLYDTIIFITAVVVLVSFIIEFLMRIRVSLGLGLLLGICGLFLGMRYELVEIASAGDTMGSVVAVLDTNYYLAIHVTTIAIGYSGGLFAAAFGIAWIIGRLFGFREDDKQYHKGVARMVYGTLCFSLFFALFGTVMGGIWANDSWGRFWGWDPKENGALLIVIWLLLSLHMRLGGFVRDRGMAVMAVITGAVVGASWWGVNLLEVGLHSYGFTSGVAIYLYTFWGFLFVVLCLSQFDVMRRKAT